MARRRQTGEPSPGARTRAADERFEHPAETRSATGRGRSSTRVAEGARSQSESSGCGLYGSDVGADPGKASLAELVVTFILVFAGIAAATAAALERPIAGSPYDSVVIALAFGLALAAVVAAIGHVSGAHVNPAVTLGLAATGKFPWKLVAPYLLAQFGVAILA